MCLLTGGPSTIFSNVGQPFKNGYEESDLDLVVFNTKWSGGDGLGRRSMVLHPPIFKREYLVERQGSCITQINLSRKKGSELFWGDSGGFAGEAVSAVKGRKGIRLSPMLSLQTWSLSILTST